MDANLGFLLSKASRLLKWEFNRHLEDYGLTLAQWTVLIDLAIQEERGLDLQQFTPASIAERIYADRPTVSGIVERLRKKELIEVRENPQDRRSQIIMVTDKARKLLPELKALSDESVHKAVQNFSGQEITELKNYLARMIENLT